MSDSLRGLDAAIQTYIATNYEGSLVDSWILVTHSQNVEQHTTSNYRIITPDVQPIHVDAGLLATGERIVQDSWDESFDDTDD